MYKKKGFTLIELILVLSILVILAWMWSRYLSTLDAERAYSESCTNSIYSDLADWVYYASTSRVLANDVTPDYYILQMNGTWYDLKYWTWNSSSNTATWTLYLSRHVEDFMYCRQSRNYHNVMVADFSKIRMLPALVPDWDKSWFKIYYDWNESKRKGECVVEEGSSRLCPTWSITMKFCPKSDVESACVEFWQIFFDARTWMVRKRLCKVYDKKNVTKCKERSTWH